MEQKKKICIVEDDDYIREIYATKLESSGYEVFTAVNGEDGLEVIIKNKPDLIILDLMMPVKNGVEVLEDLDKSEEFSAIPVIVLTNADDEKTIKEVSKFETRFYITKSLTTPQKVVGIVREVLH